MAGVLQATHPPLPPSLPTGIIRPRLRALGMQSGRIRNTAVTASSAWNRFHLAWRGRLKRKRRGRYVGAWASRVNDRHQWLQVAFGGAKKVVAVATQGRQDANQCVTSYRLSYSMDGDHFVSYKQRGRTTVRSVGLSGFCFVLFFLFC